ncbi:MAG: hypothetical protein IKV20_02765 [Clostridia bacterium]|nr:hypothetical protein [Clostridia bacterium]
MWRRIYPCLADTPPKKVRFSAFCVTKKKGISFGGARNFQKSLAKGERICYTIKNDI